MGDKSKIEWTDASWNPVTGCDKVSPGCAHCYAEGVADRFWAKQYPEVPISTPADLDETNTFHRPRKFTDVMCHEDRLDQPLRWKRPRRIFVNSMSDLFHEDVPDAFIDKVFAVMALAPQHTFQVLTKRADRMFEYMSSGHCLWNGFHRLVGPTISTHDQVESWCAANGISRNERDRRIGIITDGGGFTYEVWPLHNVWLGVSVENQRFADERIPLLLQTPAAVRFISAEPLLGAVDLAKFIGTNIPGPHDCPDWGDIPDTHCIRCGVLWEEEHECPPGFGPTLNWAIVGGESGRGARPFHIDWARTIVQQCQAAGVPCFVKQLGADPRWNGDWWLLDTIKDSKGGTPEEWPEDLRVRQFPEVRT